MINVDVEDYCQMCMDFVPDVTKPTKMFLDNGDYFQSDTIIRCEHRNRCAMIKRYLERQLKEKEEAVG